MPELPEVETTCQGITPHILNQTIVDMVVRNSSLRWPVSEDGCQVTPNTQITRVERRGKYIKIYIDDLGYWLVHLGMSGSLRIIDASEPVMKHDHVDLVLADGIILRFNDPRRFGCWLFHSSKVSEPHALLAKLGPEPLSDAFDAKMLWQAARNKKQSIKQFIMDSHVVVGVGNIYASESLFKSGINPKRAANRVSLERYAVLVDAIKAVLAFSIKQGGTTLRDFVNSDGKPGYFQQQLQVYGRDGESCRVCDTPIKKIVQSNRSTFYCPACQK
ncbi:MAG: bifunctional DNA-formamidopyrimidine glycosylase/DNA-(apurinic or apyrimidinic site) lyase [Cellvibrionales bacterium]|nr:bifunctional DNA-formamidopyrimidine glycosylase/DNA-(apurinic or apyrimidinic site) lyase [Cellvibrionales bacterium]